MAMNSNVMDDIQQGTRQVDATPLKVNNHLHTPHSFSAFDHIDQALDMAQEEGVRVVGVNDFYTFSAFRAWNKGARERGLFPLFNVEFIGANQEDKEKGLRINDPSNPGRMYLSGKGLAFPSVLPEDDIEMLKKIQDQISARMQRMTGRLNTHFKSLGLDLQLDFESLRSELTKGMVRERHLARAVRLLVETNSASQEKQCKLYQLILGKDVSEKVANATAMEDEIRSALLKVGKVAYEEEDPRVFLDSWTIRDIIVRAGGIPTYPFLADVVKDFTNFERDKEEVAEELKRRGIWSVEFMPFRNEPEVVEDYVLYLHQQGFIVTFGTEHNSPSVLPIEVQDKAGNQLDEDLIKINYEGACILAAHQYLYLRDNQGVLNRDLRFNQDKRVDYFELGNRIIKQVAK